VFKINALEKIGLATVLTIQYQIEKEKYFMTQKRIKKIN
jgi:hypothetical protein